MKGLAFRYCFAVCVFFGFMTMIAIQAEVIEAGLPFALATVIFGLLSAYLLWREREEKEEELEFEEEGWIPDV